MKRTAHWLPLGLLLILVVPILFSIAAAPVTAVLLLSDTYVNAATGNDGNSGNSPSAPKKTIASAIGITADNGTIHVAPGTYREQNLDLNETMNLIGSGALTTIIDANSQGTALRVSSQPYQRNTISGFTITGGAPFGSNPGGGLYIAQAHIVTLNDCAIVGNSADVIGGGIYNEGGALYMNRCTVSGNSAGNSGGGVATIRNFGGDSGRLDMTNCTISGNAVLNAVASGGGLFCGSDTIVNLLNVTIANNRAVDPVSVGGGFSNGSISSLYLKNCIVANNTAGIAEFGNQYNALATGTHSLGNNLSSGGTTYFDQPSDLNNTNPQLGPLQNNGGPTSTLAITTSSPAYNHGDRSAAPDTDQRGVARPAGTFCSIGAFEPAVQNRSGLVNTNLGTVSFVISAGSFAGLRHFDRGNLPCVAPGYDFPYGMFAFNITDLAAGSSVTVRIKFPTPVALDAKYYKCQNGALIDCTSLVTRPDAYTALLTLTDGGLGDADRSANGTILDPGGPALPIKLNPVSHGASMPAAPQAPISLPSISVKSAKLSAARVAPGSPITVTADVANTGAVNGTSRITLHVNGEVDSTQGVTITSGTSSPVSFAVSRSQPGTYSVYVGGVSAGSFIVDQFADSNVIPIISGALLFFAFIMGLVYIYRRK